MHTKSFDIIQHGVESNFRNVTLTLGILSVSIPVAIPHIGILHIGCVRHLVVVHWIEALRHLIVQLFLVLVGMKRHLGWIGQLRIIGHLCAVGVERILPPVWGILRILAIHWSVLILHLLRKRRSWRHTGRTSTFCTIFALPTPSFAPLFRNVQNL